MDNTLLPEPQPADVSFEDMLACVDRELKMRRQVYPRWVASGKLKQSAADLEILKMRAVRRALLCHFALHEAVRCSGSNALVSQVDDMMAVGLDELTQLHPETA